MRKAIITRDMICTLPDGTTEKIDVARSNTEQQNWDNLKYMFPQDSTWQGRYIDNDHFEITI